MKEDRRFVVETWLKKYQDIFNTHGLDRWLNFPKGTIQKFYKHDRILSNSRINKIYRSVKEIIYDFEKRSLDDEINNN